MHSPVRRRYAAACHGIAAALLAALLLIARPSLLVAAAAAYPSGWLAARLIDGIGRPGRVAGQSRPGWTLRAWLRRPSAGAAAAILLFLSLLPARTLGMNALMAAIGIETVLLGLTLTMVDDSVVRFMSIAGHGWRGIFAYHARALFVFMTLAVPACWLALGTAAASVVIGASTAVMLFLALRVFAYRLHGRRFADILVSILVGLILFVAYAMPVIAPLFIVVVLWRLQRRGAAKLWLLA